MVSGNRGGGLTESAIARALTAKGLTDAQARAAIGGAASVAAGLRAAGLMAAASGALRVAPISATEAYIIAPHATLGAVALHLLKGNGADTSTPDQSVGAPFGDWRIQGLRILPGVDSNPATQASEVIYQGTGAQQIAIRRNSGGGWVGHFHGFGAGADYAQTAPDLTQAATLSAAQITSTGRAKWSDVAYFDFTDVIDLKPNGSIATTTSVAMPFDPAIAYLDMTIVNAGFIRASLDGGATWIDLGAMDGAAFETRAADVPSIIMRNPATGTTVTIADDALDGTAGRAKVIMRRPSDFKVYPDLNPTPNGTNLGSVSVARTITLGKTTPDPTVTLTAASVSQAEGSGVTTYTFTVQRSAAAGSASIPWTFAAGTTSAADFVSGVYPTGGNVALAAGAATGTFTVQVQGDTTAEPDEAFTVTIRAPLGYAPGATMSATGTILNDDAGTAYVWSGEVNGDSIPQSSWNPAMRTWDAAAKQYVFTRATNTGGGNHRSIFPVAGLTIGQAYSLPLSAQIVGGSPSAGVTFGMSTDAANGGGQTGVVTMSAAYANGSTPYTFTATATTMYLVINQGPAAGSDNIFRLSSIGPLA